MIAVEDFGYDGQYIHNAKLQFSWSKPPDPKNPNVTMFNYCPLCGTQLIQATR